MVRRIAPGWNHTIKNMLACFFSYDSNPEAPIMASAHVLGISMCTVIFGIALYHVKLENDKEQG